jgi:hypothetical protein
VKLAVPPKVKRAEFVSLENGAEESKIPNGEKRASDTDQRESGKNGEQAK